MSGIRFLPLDGADSIGGSKLLLEFDDSRVLLDFGTNFHQINKYYEEFLKPRATCGILDYVAMGVLPDARGIYRDDLIHPDVSLKGPQVGKVDAVFISHAHVDHTGSLGFLKQEVPVVASLMSAAIAKAMQDSMSTGLGMDGVYATPKSMCEFRGSSIIRTGGKEMFGRDFCMTDAKPSEEFQEFWAFSPSQAIGAKSSRQLIAGELLSSIPGIKYAAHPVDHSIKGANGYVISTSRGNVVYTGDIRLHGLEGDKTRRFAEAAAKSDPYILIIEGTTVGRSSEQVSEKEVSKNVSGLVADAKEGFVIADFGPRNIERLEIVLKAAKENGRRLVVPTKDAYLLSAMNLADHNIPVPGKDILIYECPRGTCPKWEEWVLDHRFPGTTVKPATIRDSPGEYILAFSFWDIKHLVDLNPGSGHYIYSSSEAFSEEQEVDFKRLGSWLDKFGIEYHGFGFDKDGKPKFPKGLHASGHASEDDIREIVKTIDPEVIIPVHTEEPGWFEKEFGGSHRVIQSSKCKWVDL